MRFCVYYRQFVLVLISVMFRCMFSLGFVCAQYERNRLPGKTRL